MPNAQNAEQVGMPNARNSEHSRVVSLCEGLGLGIHSTFRAYDIPAGLAFRAFATFGIPSFGTPAPTCKLRGKSAGGNPGTNYCC